MVNRKTSPPTVRRKSLSRTSAETDTASDSPRRAASKPRDQFDDFAEGIRKMLVRQYKALISAYLIKIAGANDPDYPRTEIVQQMKQTASAMYSASAMACVTKCDVADDSPLIMYCFSVGVFVLVAETLRAMMVSEPVPEWICSEVMGTFRSNPAGGFAVSFTEVEKFIDKIVVRVPSLQDLYAGQPVSAIPDRPKRTADTPPPPERTSPRPSQAKPAVVATPTSQARLVTFQARTPNSQVRPLANQGQTPNSQSRPFGIQASTPISQSRPFGMHASTPNSQVRPQNIQATTPNSQSRPLALEATTPNSQSRALAVQASQPRSPFGRDINELAKEVIHHMGKVGRMEGEFTRTAKLMDALTGRVAEKIRDIHNTRRGQYFSQSSQLLH